MRLLKLCLSVMAMVVASVSPILAQEVLVTSSGQSLDAFTARTMLTRAGVESAYDPLAGVDQLDGKQILIVAVGASIKGFGAAGITAEHELARTQELIDAAKANGIRIIGVHIGGTERRGGQSEQFIQLIADNADAFVVSQAGNEDGYFTTVAETRGIPVEIIDMPAQVGTALSALVE
ncbi:MAG TPA: DUF6305 family protein [Pelagibacterium sp.]|uniref:DUF6305 family protein n=1 Tax=Pelagibacterium sp. TaxID=1967288 RepID=UPI002D1A9E5A|nr:DUF6305 family protein [Pelagibacterium sp.]HWJ88292.1 DUF6305 family protein [Pelagibacterium sp.]